MVTKILTTISVATKLGKKKGIVYRSPRIYLPTKLTDDSSFPFLEGQKLTVSVKGKRLVVERFEVPNAKHGRRRRAVSRKGILVDSDGIKRRRRVGWEGLRRVSGFTRR